MVACRFIWIRFELDKSERDQSFHLITHHDQSSCLKKHAKALFDNLLLDQIVFDGGDFNRGTLSYRTFLYFFVPSFFLSEP